jgi:hypothetical protein
MGRTLIRQLADKRDDPPAVAGQAMKNYSWYQKNISYL